MTFVDESFQLIDVGTASFLLCCSKAVLLVDLLDALGVLPNVDSDFLDGSDVFTVDFYLVSLFEVEIGVGVVLGKLAEFFEDFLL